MRRDTVTVWRDDAGQARWTWSSANGRILGDSGEGYKNERACRKQAQRLAAGVGAKLIDQTR